MDKAIPKARRNQTGFVLTIRPGLAAFFSLGLDQAVLFPHLELFVWFSALVVSTLPAELIKTSYILAAVCVVDSNLQHTIKDSPHVARWPHTIGISGRENPYPLIVDRRSADHRAKKLDSSAHRCSTFLRCNLAISPSARLVPCLAEIRLFLAGSGARSFAFGVSDKAALKGFRRRLFRCLCSVKTRGGISS